jgi:hypothetical protein
LLAYFPEFGLVYLCAVFAKNEKANLSPAEREEYRELLVAFERYLRRHWREGLTP